jgi:phage terminase Nu1 subunit (DNA packaging protein)
LDSDILTLDEVAGVFRVTEKAVRGWIAAGMPVVTQGKQGRGNATTISLRKATEWYFSENYERLELDRARTRLADEQSRKVALENATRTGELGELSIWQRELEKFFGELRAAFLAFPVKLAPQLDGDVNQRKDLLEREVFALLQSISGHSGGAAAQRVSKSDQGIRNGTETPAETDGKRVGRRQKKAVRRKQRRAGSVAN